MIIFAVRTIHPAAVAEDFGRLYQTREQVITNVGKDEWHQVEPKVWWIFSRYQDTDGLHAIVYRVQELSL